MSQSLKDNLGFIGICLAIFAALFCIALVYERLAMKNRRKLSSTHYITYTAIFSSLAGVLMVLEIPLFFAPMFYKMDMSEIPVLICTFYLGPVAGVVCEFVKVVVKLMIKGTTTAFVGDFANFAIGCSFVLPASMIYHIKKSRKSALIGMLVGAVVMTVFGSLFNAVYLLPKFSQMYGVPLDALVAMGTDVNGAINSVSTLVLFAVVPFNLVKGVIDSVLTFLLYKRISPILHKEDTKRVARRAGDDQAARPDKSRT